MKTSTDSTSSSGNDCPGNTAVVDSGIVNIKDSMNLSKGIHVEIHNSLSKI
jgi:hypothetical protein